MIAAKPIDVRAKLKDYFDIAWSGEPVIVSRKQNKNVVIISETEYNEMQKAKRNLEYMESLNRSLKQFDEGKTVTKSLDELMAMEGEQK